MDLSKVLAARILQEADKRNLSIKKLAEKSNLPASTIHNIIEGSRKNPTLFTLVSISTGLGMSVSELLDVEEFKNIFVEDLKNIKEEISNKN